MARAKMAEESSGHTAGRTGRNSAREYKAQLVELCRQPGKTPHGVAKELGLTVSAVRSWVKQAKVEEGKGRAGGLTTAEREERSKLRREVRQLRQERDILEAATVFFPRVHVALRRKGRRVSRKRVEARMRVLGLVGRRSRRCRRTTEANREHDKARNILDRRREWPSPNQAWVGDITFDWTAEGWAYLAILVDLCTRAVVGWAVSDRCDTELAIRALEAAVARHRPRAGLLHHTDRGSTSTSDNCRARLSELGMLASMSRTGNCWGDAVAESASATIKTEYLDGLQLRDGGHLATMRFPYIESFYKRRRLHSTLGDITPAEKQQRVAHVKAVA